MIKMLAKTRKTTWAALGGAVLLGALLVAGGFAERGYWAIGSEIIAVPAVMLVYFALRKEGRADGKQDWDV